jgi:hypothetical protein
MYLVNVSDPAFAHLALATSLQPVDTYRVVMKQVRAFFRRKIPSNLVKRPPDAGVRPVQPVDRVVAGEHAPICSERLDRVKNEWLYAF